MTGWTEVPLARPDDAGAEFHEDAPHHFPAAELDQGPISGHATALLVWMPKRSQKASAMIGVDALSRHGRAHEKG